MNHHLPGVHFVPRSTDLTGLFRMDCPKCGREVKVQGNAMGLWITEHPGGLSICPGSNLTIKHELS